MLEWGASSKTNLNLNMTDYTMSIRHQPFFGNQPLLHVYIYTLQWNQTYNHLGKVLQP